MSDDIAGQLPRETAAMTVSDWLSLEIHPLEELRQTGAARSGERPTRNHRDRLMQHRTMIQETAWTAL